MLEQDTPIRGTPYLSQSDGLLRNMSSKPVLVLDNGADSIKAGWSTQDVPTTVPNAIARNKSSRKVHTGSQIDACENKAGLMFKRPFDKGYLVDLELQRDIWGTIFDQKNLNVTPAESSIVVTEPQFNFSPLKEALDELIFEEYGFDSMYRCPASDLCAFKSCQGGSPGCVVVDSGFSFTHAIPYVQGKRIQGGIRRLNLGGKALTNQLKDVISLRQLDVSEETHVVEEMKKHISFVAEDFASTLNEAKMHTTHTVEYVLPNFDDIKSGFIKVAESPSKKRKIDSNNQSLVLSNERFAVPELLFKPSDVGFEQAGVSTCVHEGVSSLKLFQRPLALGNVVCVGGNARIPGFRDRLFNEIRSMTMEDIHVNVSVPEYPEWYAWQGGCDFAKSADYSMHTVTKAEYEESGHKACFNKFDSST